MNKLKYPRHCTSVFVYRNPTHIDQYLHCNSHDQISYKESVCCLFVYKVLKVNGLKEMGIRKTLLVQSLPELLTIPACFIHNNKRKPHIFKRKISELAYVEGTGENLRPILRSHQTTSTFYTESTLRKLICKSKD